jgi:NitT/TauT family transport system substrate-binding protein
VRPDPVDSSVLSRRAFLERTTAAVAATGVGGVFLSACGATDSGGGVKKSGSGKQQLTVVNILPPIMGYAPEMIADLDGHFAAEGLSVKVETARGSAPAIQSVIAGKALMTRAGVIETVAHIANESAPLVGVGMMTHSSPLAVVSDKGKALTSPQQFAGKTIGIPSEGGTSENTLDVMLAAGNIAKQKVRRQVTGFSPGTFGLIEKGRIDGYIVSAASQAQFKQQVPKSNLMFTAKYVTDGESYLASKANLDKNREIIQKYLSAVRKATLQIIADKNLDKTLATIRGKYDFDGLASDATAKPALRWLIDSWLADGRQNILQAMPDKWQSVYDELAKVKVVDGGKNAKAWVSPVLT